jgi:putative oxidoreductase
MKILHVLGKYLYLIPLAIFGLFHFMNAEAMSGIVPAFLPVKVVWVYLTGAALIAAVVAVIMGKKAKLALQLLGLMLLLFALLIWLPGAIGGDQTATSMFLKDAALAGAAWWASKDQSD